MRERTQTLQIMKYFHAEPQVAGELGPRTLYISSFPTRVAKMEYLFDAWPSDDLVQAHPCFGISNELQEHIKNSALTGFELRSALVGTTDYFEGLSSIPVFYELLPVGIAGTDDFGLDDSHKLILSGSSVDLIQKFRVTELDLKPYKTNT